jgi:hypothetical protein
MNATGWYCDPYGIHSDRWFSGGQPTYLVRDQDVESRDEPPPWDPPLPLVPVAEVEVNDGSDMLRADDIKRMRSDPVDVCAQCGIGFS